MVAMLLLTVQLYIGPTILIATTYLGLCDVGRLVHCGFAHRGATGGSASIAWPRLEAGWCFILKVTHFLSQWLEGAGLQCEMTMR